MSSSIPTAEVLDDAEGDKGLKGGALGLMSSVVIGVASTAAACSLAATLDAVALAVGLQSPAVIILAFHSDAAHRRGLAAAQPRRPRLRYDVHRGLRRAAKPDQPFTFGGLVWACGGS